MMSSWGSGLKRESMERCGMSWDLFGMETERETEEVGTDTREEQEDREEARNIFEVFWVLMFPVVGPNCCASFCH